MRSRSSSATVVSIILPTDESSQINILLSALVDAGHHDLHYQHHGSSALILISSKMNRIRIDGDMIEHFTKILGSKLPGVKIDNVDRDFFSYDGFIPYTLLLEESLLAVNTNSKLLIKILRSVVRSNVLIGKRSSEYLANWCKANDPDCRKSNS